MNSRTLSKLCHSFQSQPNSSTLVHSKRSFESQTRTFYGYKRLRILAFSIASEVGSLFHRPPTYHDVCHSDSPSPSARVLPHLRKISILNAQKIDLCVPSSLCGVCVTGSLLVKVDQRILHRCVNCYHTWHKSYKLTTVSAQRRQEPQSTTYECIRDLGFAYRCGFTQQELDFQPSNFHQSGK